MLTNLWKAYANASDSKFVLYIQRKRDAYDEGQDVNVDTLMGLAENKYKTLLLDDQWNSPTEEQNQIVALAAEVKKLKDERLKSGKKTIKARKK